MKGRKYMVLMLMAVMLLGVAAPSFAANRMAADPQQIAEEGEDAAGAGETEAAEPEAGGEDEAEPPADEGENLPEAEEGDAPEEEAVTPKAKGIEVTYTGYKENLTAVATTIFTVNANGTTYTGTCAKQGIGMKTSGTATITKIANSEKIAKAVYHYAVELGDENWWDSPANTDKVGKIIGMSSESSTRVTKRRMVECFCQMYNMGADEWYMTITDPKKGGWGKDESAKIRNYYNNMDLSGVKVPEGFEIWFADAGDAQPFIIWAYDSSGYVTMKKVSGNSSITG